MRGLVAGERESDCLRGACSAVLGGKVDLVLGPAQVEIGIAPSVKIGGPPQGLSGSFAAGLARVVDKEDGEMETPLQRAQV